MLNMLSGDALHSSFLLQLHLSTKALLPEDGGHVRHVSLTLKEML